MRRLGIYRCTRCGRVGRAFAFWWFDGGPVTGEPSVWCPACKVSGSVVDQHDRAADPLAPPEDAHVRVDRLAWEVNRAVNRALRAAMAGAGRQPHGPSAGIEGESR